MISEFVQTPEFSAPLPRWSTAACLALSLLLIALLLDRPPQNNGGAFALVATATATR